MTWLLPVSVASPPDVDWVCSVPTHPKGFAGIFDDDGTLVCAEGSELRWLEPGQSRVRHRELGWRVFGPYGDVKKTFVDPRGTAWVGFWAGEQSKLASTKQTIDAPWTRYHGVARTQPAGTGCWLENGAIGFDFHWNGTIVSRDHNVASAQYCDEEVAVLEVPPKDYGSQVLVRRERSAWWLPAVFQVLTVATRGETKGVYLLTGNGLEFFPITDGGMSAAAGAMPPADSTPLRMRADVRGRVHVVVTQEGPFSKAHFSTKGAETVVDISALLRGRVVSDVHWLGGTFCLSVQEETQASPARMHIGRMCIPMPPPPVGRAAW